MSQVLSRRAASGQASMTMAVAAKAASLKAKGKDIVEFAAGEPDFKTPEHICEAAIKAIHDGVHGYLANAGHPALREAVCMRFQEDLGLTYQPKEILIGAGAKMNCYLACQALVDDGDEVIIPVPYWVSYPEMVRLAGGTPVFLQTDAASGFKLTAEAIEQAITPKTKMLILNSPSNPSGAVIDKAELQKIAAVLEKHNVLCMSDEIYDKLVYGENKHISIAGLSDYCRQNTIVINGCSKAYAMTGWRIGFSAAPEAITKAMANIQSHSTSNACSISQMAAIAALTGPQDCVQIMCNEFAARRDLIVSLLNNIEGITCAMPGGAFYVMPEFSALLGKTLGGIKIGGSVDFCNAALESVLVAPVPGCAFGEDHHIRLSYATSRELIEKGCARLKLMVEDRD